MSKKNIFIGLLAGAVIMVWTVFAGATVRIMPSGDSLTRGCCPTDSGCDLGYRYPLYKKLVNEGLDVNFVGSQKHPIDTCSIFGVPTDFDRDHEGYYGKRADQVRDDIYGNLEINPADIVLLDIGTNDLLQSQTISSTVDEISQIIDNINLFATQHSRIIYVILARINNKVPESNTWSQFNIELASRWYGSNVDIVDMEYDPGFIYEFDPVGDFKDDAYDVHPIQPIDDDAVERGYEKMVGVWYDALKPYFSGPYNDWTTRTSGTGENLYGVARGSGTYVAVGNLGTIVTSQDGVSWAKRNSGTFFDLMDVIYADGTFVAVGWHGTVATSTDGITWTAKNIAGVTNRTFYGLTYGNGTFVAVGDNGTLLTSPDGVTWNARQLATTSQLHDVAYGNGIFVAVGNDYIVSSSNLINWNYFSNARNDGVAYGNGRFVVVGSDGSVEISTNGTSWTQKNLGIDKDLYEVTYGIGTFLAVGYDGTIVTSPDGTTWTPRSSRTNKFLWGVTFWDALPVAVGFNGTIIQRSYAPGDDCGPEMVVDCLNSCVFSNRLGDGHCDDYLYPNFDCIEFNYDEGDCIHPGDELAADFGTNGLWHYDGASWSKLTTWNPDDDLAGWSGGMAVDFGGDGLWNHDGSLWSMLTGWNPGSGGLAGWSGGLAVDFDADGLWVYDGTSWSKKTSWNPDNLAGWSGGLAVDFNAERPVEL